MTAEADRFYMGVALDLARRGKGRTSPNPAVGCVVVRDGRIWGKGYHPEAGAPHAEVFALDEAGPAARDAHLYVTLEPCSHHGRTPPCVNRVIGAGVRRVVAATLDPNPAVAGAGIEALRAAGIRVETGVREAEARLLNEGFALSIREKRAFVHLKLAATLDGKIATRTGDSRWITSEESRYRVHLLRDACGVIVVGASTAVHDDPHLTVRLPGRPERRILRVILDPNLRTPMDLRCLAAAEAPFTRLVAASDVSGERARPYEDRGIRILRVPRHGNRLDLSTLLRQLYSSGHMEVLVEGGGETARAFLDAGLVDRAHLFLSPRLLGGRDATPMIGGGSPSRIDEALPLDEVEVERVGGDLYVRGIPRRS